MTKARDEFSDTKGGAKISRRGRPKNPLIARLMSKGGVSRRTAFRRLKAKRKARLAKAARLGNGRDCLNQHADGYYPTPPRGARALLARESFGGVLWECACGDGAISKILEAAGFEVVSTDLMDRGYGRGGHDFLADNTTLADHIITNPPYGRCMRSAQCLRNPGIEASPSFEEADKVARRPGGDKCASAAQSNPC
jgi:hypothetical protein